MTDVFAREKRSEIMRRVKSKNTSPELVIRTALSAKGIRYRLNVSRLPGTPDIVIGKLKTVIFINGCFWHQHHNCKKKKIPKSNRAYWATKLAKNVSRQRRDVRALRKLGWSVYKIWECEISNKIKLAHRLNKFLRHDQIVEEPK